jgi:hypothetical protein
MSSQTSTSAAVGGADPRPAAVTFITTEHFTLQGARAAAIAESAGRATMFLGSVSAGLVALGLIATATRIGATFYAFGVIVLATLSFVGAVTFERVLQSGGVQAAQPAARVCGPAGSAAQQPASGGRCAALAAARAPGHEPHDDDDGHRDQPDDEKRLERGKDPARSRDGKPYGEDRAEDCPDDPAHVPSMRPGPVAGDGRAGRPGPGPGLCGRLAGPPSHVMCWSTSCGASILLLEHMARLRCWCCRW